MMHASQGLIQEDERDIDEPWWMIWLDRALKGAIFLLVAILAAVIWTLFNTENYTAHTIHAKGVLSAQECKRIIEAAESTAATRSAGWETERHHNYPTTDFAITSVPVAAAMWNSSLKQRILPMMNRLFGLDDEVELHVEDIFIVKYDAHAQSGLRSHRDGSHMSFNVALNPSTDYSGGGTRFATLDTVVRIDRGDILMHSSGIVHAGVNVTSGTRYILVGFITKLAPWWDELVHSYGFTAKCFTHTYLPAPPSARSWQAVTSPGAPADGVLWDRYRASHDNAVVLNEHFFRETTVDGATRQLECVALSTSTAVVLGHVYSILQEETPTLFGFPLLLYLLFVCVLWGAWLVASDWFGDATGTAASYCRAPCEDGAAGARWEKRKHA
eukprot:m.680396 g.680396  ORF g.680396 m.680396 type:complete len:386 (+) comp22810_c0_seq90:206-1363(+)